MATSRTGTSTWKNLRLKVLRRAQRHGILNCPSCNVELDYKQGRNPNSAEVDHIVPHSRGGQDVIDNCMVLCRWCNQRKGAGDPKPGSRGRIKTSRQW